MVPVHQSGTIVMSLLTENQLTDIVDMIVDDYGSRLTGGEVSEIAGLILENISGFESVDSNTFTQVINEIGTYTIFGTTIEPIQTVDSEIG